VFFIDGPVGTGKTYLYSAILAQVRATHHIAMAVASSGVAALLLEGGVRWRYSALQVQDPPEVDDTSTCT